MIFTYWKNAKYNKTSDTTQAQNGGSKVIIRLTRSSLLLDSALIILLLTLCSSTLCECYVVIVPQSQHSLPITRQLNPFKPWFYNSRLKRQIYNAQSSSVSPSSSSSTSAHHVIESRLSINVRNNGGEVLLESIYSNVQQNYVRFEFVESDGTRVRHLVDFANNVSITRIVRLGEHDLHEPRVRSYCFVTRLPGHEYIAPEAMAKLTQRNPWTIRQAELDHGSVAYRMDLSLSLSASSLLTPHLSSFCATSSSSQSTESPIYADESDLKLWTSLVGNRSYYNLTSASVIKKLDYPNTSKFSNSFTSSNNTSSVPERCGDQLRMIYHNISSSRTTNRTSTNFTTTTPTLNRDALSQLFHNSNTPRRPCLCSVSVVMPFHPCSIKYCTQPDPTHPEKMIQTRCGIRTCRRKYEFKFTVPDKLVCLYDFDPNLPKTNQI